MVSLPTAANKDNVSLPREHDGVQNILDELKSKGLIDRKVKAIKKSSIMLSFKASTLRKTRIFYNGNCANMDDDSLRFILLHEDGHHRNKQNSKLMMGMLLTIIVSSMLLFALSSHYDSFSLSILYGLTPLYIALFIFSLRIFQEPLQEDEYASDLYAATLLKEQYGMREPCKVAKKALESIAGLKGPESFIERVKNLLGYDFHPPVEERVKYIRESLERRGE